MILQIGRSNVRPNVAGSGLVSFSFSARAYRAPYLVRPARARCMLQRAVFIMQKVYSRISAHQVCRGYRYLVYTEIPVRPRGVV